MSRVFTRSRVAVALSLLMVLSLLALPASGAPPERKQEPVEEAVPEAPDVQVPDVELEDLYVPQSVVEELKAQKAERTYIVVMDDLPVVAYHGGIRGLKATAPGEGKKINPNSRKVVRYMDHLAAGHDVALEKVGVGASKKLYSYGYTIDAFAARMTGVQAAALAADPMVIAVVEDQRLQLDTISTADFLGVSGEGGMWDQGGLGEDVIIGIIDSGVWPEHPSFSDRTGTNKKGKSGKLDYQQIPGWHGKCVPGEAFNASMCNHKLIGAQFYLDGFESAYGAGVKDVLPYEILSPRDVDGHGTHTATTAGGNANVVAEADGLDLGVATGMAPRARISAYKACWGFGGDDFAGCFTADTVAAIDQAVADGVDVINYSISGTSTNFFDPVEIAFLYAADAGVFVAASAGNSGPGASTVAHPSPWITTVAAGTHDRYFEATVTLGNGATYTGASFQTTGTGELSLVHAGSAPADGFTAAEAAICTPGSLDGAVVAGKMVMCDRGVYARVAKSAEVARVGGVAMIHGNTGQPGINADIHSVPTVHLYTDDANEVRTYIADAAEPSASMSPGVFVADTSAPNVAGFSSRGPLLASADLLKPDIMAPGVDIIAGVSPIGYGGRLFDSLSGTSMSGPHIAGLAAVVAGAYPDWSPAMVKSALMTTADDVVGLTPFDVGSGHVNPTAALDPGLVYDAGWSDYLGFLFGDFDPSDLNQPNIAIGELAGQQTVTRTVTNVGESGTYTVSVDGLAGIDVAVDPMELTLNTGESASYTVTFTTTEGAAIGEYAFGNLTWSDGTRTVESTLVVRPVQAAVAAELSAAGTSGALSFDIGFGYSGAYTAAPHGLVPAWLTPGTVTDDPANDYNTALGSCDFGVPFPWPCTGITWHIVFVPPGSALTRISLFDEYTDGADDLDLYVYDALAGFSFVGGSGSFTSAEQVDFVPVPGGSLYAVGVHGWQTDGPDANYVLFDWSVPATPGSANLSIDGAPTEAVLGTVGTIDVSWSGLAPDTKYLGAVSHADGGGIFSLTLLSIDTD